MQEFYCCVCFAVFDALRFSFLPPPLRSGGPSELSQLRGSSILSSSARQTILPPAPHPSAGLHFALELLLLLLVLFLRPTLTRLLLCCCSYYRHQSARRPLISQHPSPLVCRLSLHLKNLNFPFPSKTSAQPASWFCLVCFGPLPPECD